MEQSSLISNVIIKLQIAYPSYFNKLSQEESIALAQMYKDELSKYSEGILSSSIKNIIRNNKFMPNLSEIIGECEKNNKRYVNGIIELMKQDGYFKNATELDKVYMWLDKGIIPSWLKEDMSKYDLEQLTNKTLMIEGN
jgi:phage-related tail protein